MELTPPEANGFRERRNTLLGASSPLLGATSPLLGATSPLLGATSSLLGATSPLLGATSLLPLPRAISPPGKCAAAEIRF